MAKPRQEFYYYSWIYSIRLLYGWSQIGEECDMNKREIIVKEFKNKPYNKQYLLSFLESLGYKDIEVTLTDDQKYLRFYMKESEEDRTLFIRNNADGTINQIALYKGNLKQFKSTSLGCGLLLLAIVGIAIGTWFLMKRF